MSEHDHRPVLLATDGEAGSDAALHFAAREAAARGCGLTLLHVFQVLPTGPETALLELSDAQEIATRRLRLGVEHARDVLAGRVEVTGTLVRSSIVQGVVDASAEAQLVVLQRRDRAALARLVTRSTSNGIAAHAHAPVAVVPERWTDDDTGPDGRSGVLVGLDVSTHSLAILRQALGEARARQAALRVVHACWSPGYFNGTGVGHIAHPSWSTEAAEEISGIVDEVRAEIGDVPVSIQTIAGRPPDVLVAASGAAELVVVGRHDPLVPTGSHLGPVARAVLRAAGCPVLLVAPSPAHRGWHVPRRRVAPQRHPSG
jgi:nucleotide-binding universal stress UspA family protein